MIHTRNMTDCIITASILIGTITFIALAYQGIQTFTAKDTSNIPVKRKITTHHINERRLNKKNTGDRIASFIYSIDAKRS